MNATFDHGGKPLIDFLDYCVRSIQTDPLFLFLVREYRNGPTAAKARALFELFCARTAPGRISVARSLPPYDLRLEKSLQPPAPALPPKYLFDFVAAELGKDSPSFVNIRRYKPHLTPLENLPDGKMSSVQRHFVQNVWQPIIRPQLIAAGFWRIADVA